MMKMPIGQILTLRSQWEAIVSFRKTYDLPHYNGTTENLSWFLENGHRNNRFRKNFNEAVKLAQMILEQS